jgi:putative endonuclease
VSLRARIFTVYILTNRCRTVYYIGMTNHLTRWRREHRSGRGRRFTAQYRVTDRMGTETYPPPRDAIHRKPKRKGGRRAKTLALIRTVNPGLATLPGPVG